MRKSLTKLSLWLCCLTLAFLPKLMIAQLNQGGVPKSFSFSLPPDGRDAVSLAPPDMESLRQGDEQEPIPYRFAVNLPVDIDIARSGSWDKTGDGTKIWRVTVNAPGALALTLYFDQFHIPQGGKFFAYSPKRTQLLGAFTEINNNEANTFATALIAGDRITLEYNSPEGADLPKLHLSEVAYAYRGVSDLTGDRTGFGTAGLCEVNVKCSEADNWQRQVRSIAKVEVKRGTYSVWCSGSLVNNTLNNGVPYLLTADHCGKLSTSLDLSQWVVYFNYQGTSCPNPLIEPTARTMTGVKLIAHGGDGGNTGSDFFLVKLLTAIPDTFDVYFNGWSRDTIPSPSGVGIHHPQGDIKKISTYTTPLVRSSWNYPTAYTHWRTKWAETAHGHGVTEGGSSGSPLYDNSGRLIGTLTGGDSRCDSLHVDLYDYYGMFYYHWDRNGSDSSNTLKYWLDPIQSNVMDLNGWALGTGAPVTILPVSIYPNPVTSFLNIQSENAILRQKCEIRITDLWGNIMLVAAWEPSSETEKHFDVSGWDSGMYILSVSDGESRMVKKIIKL